MSIESKGHCTEHGIDFIDYCAACLQEIELRKAAKAQPGNQLRWVKATDRRPEGCKLVIVRPIGRKDLAIIGADSGDASEWATDSSESWWFDDTEWLEESAQHTEEEIPEEIIKWIEEYAKNKFPTQISPSLENEQVMRRFRCKDHMLVMYRYLMQAIEKQNVSILRHIYQKQELQSQVSSLKIKIEQADVNCASSMAELEFKLKDIVLKVIRWTVAQHVTRAGNRYGKDYSNIAYDDKGIVEEYLKSNAK